MSHHSNIHVLVGSDFYWDLVLAEVRRQENGLVAISSKFGWLVSGPLRDANEVIVTHSNLFLQGPNTGFGINEKEIKLENELRHFWDIESLGIIEEPSTWEVFLHKSHLIFSSHDIRIGYLESGVNPLTQIISFV